MSSLELDDRAEVEPHTRTGTLVRLLDPTFGYFVFAAPPLLLIGHPGAAFAWALLAGWSKGGLATALWRVFARVGRALSRPLPAAVLHGLALWIWHAPWLFDAALEREWVHRLEHMSFFGTALLFWRAVLDAHARRIGPALVAAFATLMHGGLLGGLITMAPYSLYAWYRGRAELDTSPRSVLDQFEQLGVLPAIGPPSCRQAFYRRENAELKLFHLVSRCPGAGLRI